jgi:hypothetical protein
MAAVVGCLGKVATTQAAGATAEAAAPAATVASPPSRPAPRAPIATAEGKTAGLSVEVTELKRASGGTVTLKFTVINDSAEPAGLDELADHNTKDYPGVVSVATEGMAVGGVHLIDPVGKKKYLVARDSEGRCVCSSGVTLQYFPKGSRVNLWAKFPAPPEGVERLSVVIPGFSPMDDVPLSH